MGEHLLSSAVVLLCLPHLLVLFPQFTAVHLGTIPVISDLTSKMDRFLVGKAISFNLTANMFPILTTAFVGKMVKLPKTICALVRKSPEMQPSLEVFKKETKMFSKAE